MRKILLVSVLGILVLPAVSFTVDSMEGRAGARFTGVFSDSGIDKNGDGYFEQLMVSGEIEIDSCNDPAIFGYLSAQDGRIISVRPDAYLTALWGCTAEIGSDSGKTVFHIFFCGQDIRKHNTDGPFIANLTLLCDNFRTFTTYETFAYSHSAFPGGQDDADVFRLNLWELLGIFALVVLLILLLWRIFRRRDRQTEVSK